jgi:hypothetical protein
MVVAEDPRSIRWIMLETSQFHDPTTTSRGGPRHTEDMEDCFAALGRGPRKRIQNSSYKMIVRCLVYIGNACDDCSY